MSNWIYSMSIIRQPTPSRKQRSPNYFLGYKRAKGGKRVKTYRRRLSDAVFRTNRNLATSQYLTLEPVCIL